MNFILILSVACGGALGSVMRFCFAEWIHRFFERGFPIGTLWVNVTGSFLIGFLSVVLLSKIPSADVWRSFILIGVLGGYTTFSTFSLDSIQLLIQGHFGSALVNIFLSVFLCLTMTFFGMVLANRWF